MATGQSFCQKWGERQRISQTYLEVMFKALRKSSLVVSERGPGGGYMLARGAEEITVAEIIAAVSAISPPPRASASSSEHRSVEALDQAVYLTAVELMSTVTLAMLSLHLVRPPAPRLRPIRSATTARLPDSIRTVPNSVFELASKSTK